MATTTTQRVAFYRTATDEILCDPCSLEVCRRDASVAMSRTYAATSHASFPELTCEACGQRHVVKQS